MRLASHIRLFDLIAPLYSLFFQFQVRNYRRIIQNNLSIVMDGQYRILDIGCGTGALAFVLSEIGQSVTGIDGSARMIKIARWLNRNNQAVFQVGDALGRSDPGSPLADSRQNYDLVVASYVLHGLHQEQRMALYGTMKRLAAKRVVIMDYNQKRALLTSLVEWLERGDYFNFIKSAETEMKAIFPSVNIVQTGKRGAWYVADQQVLRQPGGNFDKTPLTI